VDEAVIEFVYDAIQGEYMNSAPPMIENAFADGAECARLYRLVYDAERRLEERLGVKPYDNDVECIICAMSDIQKYLCFKMYEYGARFGYNWGKIYGETGREDANTSCG